MSSNSLAAFAAPGSVAESSTLTLETASAVDAVLTALNDADCQTILGAVAADPLTASELADRCDLATSTTYRKLEMLEAAQLVEERVRLSPTGHHTNEYARIAEDVVVHLDTDGVTVDLVLEGDRGPSARWR
jgi:predicted transcriptional regulator